MMNNVIKSRSWEEIHLFIHQLESFTNVGVIIKINYLFKRRKKKIKAGTFFFSKTMRKKRKTISIATISHI